MSQATRILLALVAGIALGILGVAIHRDWALAVTTVTQPIGEAWLHALQMVIVPLIVGLLVTGIAATAEAARAGRIAGRAVALFVVVLWGTTLMSAAVMPLLLDAWPLPDAWSQALRAALTAAPVMGKVPTLADFFNTIVPTNVVAAASGDAFLPLTVFTLAFAFAITRLEAESRKRLTDLFQSITDAMLVIIGWVLKLAPIGIFALAYGVGARTGAAAFGALVHYIVLVSTIGFIVLLAGYAVARVFGGVPIRAFAKAVAPAQGIAISTQSSLASLPAMLKGSEAIGVAPATAGIVLPVAVAIFRATSPAMNLAVALWLLRRARRQGTA